MGPSLVGEKTGAPVELVVAVSEAGGLGVLGAAGYTVDELREAIREVRKLTDKPFGVDLLLPREIVNAGDQEDVGPETAALADLLKNLPTAHYDWVMKVKEEMQLPDIDATVRVAVHHLSSPRSPCRSASRRRFRCSAPDSAIRASWSRRPMRPG